MATMRLWLIAGLIVGLSAAGVTRASEPRKAIPDAAAQKKSLTFLTEVYGVEMRKSDPVAQRKVVDDFLKQVADPGNNAVMRYVLLKQVTERAANIGDVERALRAAVMLTKQYEVDLAEVWLDILAHAYKRAKSPEEYADVATRYITLAESAQRKNKFPLANEAAKQAYNAARKAKDDDLKSRTKNLRTRIRDTGKQYKKFTAALAVLKQVPDDAAAHLTVGEYHAFSRSNWGKGLPYLSKGADTTLADVARADMSNPTLPEAFHHIANSYYDLAQKKKKKSLSQTGLLSRAKMYYERALPSLKGLDKVQVQKRIDSIEAAASEDPRATPRKLQVKFDKKRSMAPYPDGTKKFAGIARQEGAEPTAPFFGKPIFYNQETGKHLYFSVRTPKKVSSIVLTGCAFMDCVVEVKDKNGKIIGQGGPYNIGNTIGTYTIKIKRSRTFEIHIHNRGLPMRPGYWFSLINVEFK